jgi:hypothetical protein
MGELTQGTQMLSQAAARTPPTMHLDPPDYSQQSTEKKNCAIYIVVSNIQYSTDCHLLKIGITQETSKYAANRYRTSQKYFALYWQPLTQKLDRTVRRKQI